MPEETHPTPTDPGYPLAGRPSGGASLLPEMIGTKVVIDLRSQYVALGTFLRADDAFIELKNADLHDLRDTDTSRENYVAASRSTGVKRNRKRLLLVRREMVAVSRLEDVVDE